MEKKKVFAVEGADGFDGWNIYESIDGEQGENVIDQIAYDPTLDISEQQSEAMDRTRRMYEVMNFSI